MANWIISSTILIIVIISLRFLSKGKISSCLQYALWLLVMVRLLVPFSVGETTISIGNWLTQVSQKEEINTVYEFSQRKLPSMTYQQAYEEVLDQYKEQGIDITTMSAAEFSEKVELEVQEKMASDITLMDVAKFIWGFGGIVVGFWFVFTNIRFQRKLKASRKKLEVDLKEERKLPIFICDEVDTPCLFGVLHPAIYVTGEVVKDEVVLRHVIVHETTHFMHKDHVWGYLRALCLTIHWYNPLVWCAAMLSRNDAELACDEATIKRLGENERASYGRTLIDLTCEKRSAVLLSATTMTGSGKSIKERIALIVQKPKTVVIVLITVILITAVTILSTFTGGKVNGYIDVTGMNIQYEDLPQDALVTDEKIIKNALQLILDEKTFMDVIQSECRIDDGQEVEVDGQIYYRVLEADNWTYFEDQAKKYYSERYLKDEFTGRYLEETKVYVEKDGKLYRALADGVIGFLIADSIEVWEIGKGKYYITIVQNTIGGGDCLIGYEVQLSEENNYGFEITNKPLVFSRNQ